MSSNAECLELRASGPESAEKFSEGQARWVSFSLDVIQAISDNVKAIDECDGETEFERLFTYCAEKRQQIAKELAQGGYRQSYYGERRAYFTATSESFFRQQSEKQPWPYQKEAVFKAVDGFIKAVDERDGWEENAFEDEHMTISRMQYSGKDGPYSYFIFKKCPYPEKTIHGKEHSHSLAMIIVTLKDTKQPSDIIKIQYAEVMEEYQAGDLELAQMYYEDCLAWTNDSSVDDFLIRLGRLQYHMAHLLIVKLGNAGIMGWIQRGLAKRKGVELGAYRQVDEDGLYISWDFKALITPDIEDYAKWFATCAFDSVQLKQESKVSLSSHPNRFLKDGSKGKDEGPERGDESQCGARRNHVFS